MPLTPPSPSPLARPQIPPLIAVDAAALAAAARALKQAADSLGSAVPGLGAAWSAAAAVLMRQRTGEALHVCRPTTLAAIDGCLATIESYAQALGWAAACYRRSDQAATWTA